MKGERFGMNDFNMVLINRKQLYDEIWKISVAGVAKKYNLHYAKLIKSLNLMTYHIHLLVIGQDWRVEKMYLVR